MLIIGEKINVMNKAVYESIAMGQVSAIIDLAVTQAAAGAHALDINIGPDTYSGKDIMSGLVTAIQKSVRIPLCLNGSPEIIEAGLKAHTGRAIVNGITPERARTTKLLQLAKEYNAFIIGMALPEKRYGAGIDNTCMSAMEIVEHAADEGIRTHDIYIDPVMPSFALDSEAVINTIEGFRACKEMFPDIKTIVGLNNVSEGIRGDNRIHMNKSALGALMGAGLDAVILNPLDRVLMDTVKTGRILYQHGIYCEAYLQA